MAGVFKVSVSGFYAWKRRPASRRSCGDERLRRRAIWSIVNLRSVSQTAFMVVTSPNVPTAEGFLYLAIIVDAFSRRIVGWAMAGHMRTELVINALDMAVEQRKPSRSNHHSDQGTQYTSLAFAKRCAAANIRPSTGSVGNCFDNALCESDFATLECELFDRQSFATHAAAKSAIFGFIERWYNPTRRHSALGFMSLAEFENKYWRARQNKTAIAEAP